MEKFGNRSRLIVFRDIVTEDKSHVFMDIPVEKFVNGKISHSLNTLWVSEHRLPDSFSALQNFLCEVEGIVKVDGISAHFDNLLGNYVRLMGVTRNENGEIDKLSKLITSE